MSFDPSSPQHEVPQSIAVARESRPPSWVWKEMLRGNQRFVAGEPRHPRADHNRVEVIQGGLLCERDYV